MDAQPERKWGETWLYFPFSRATLGSICYGVLIIMGLSMWFTACNSVPTDPPVPPALRPMTKAEIDADVLAHGSQRSADQAALFEQQKAKRKATCDRVLQDFQDTKLSDMTPKQLDDVKTCKTYLALQEAYDKSK